MSIADLDTKRKQAILNAALKEFAVKGFDAASTNTIAREAGISKALMFHYVGSKQELFLFVYDYFYALLDKEYHMLIRYDERDIFDRLYQVYILQMKLLKQYPWIFELNKLSALTKCEELNKEIKLRNETSETKCYPMIFESFDTTKFRTEIDIEKSKQIIYWSFTGFAHQMLDRIRNSTYEQLDTWKIEEALIDLCTQLKLLFYKTEGE